MTRVDDENATALVVATHNAGKLREMRSALAEVGVVGISAGELGLPSPEETGDTFEENAELKAVAAAKASGRPAIADDSGVCVDALGGAPGIFTARWAGEPRDFAVARERTKNALKQLGVSSGKARASWVTALAVAWPSGRVESARGVVRGVLVWPEPRPDGFGFEPMFLPDGFAITLSEMPEDLKNRVNARARAFRAISSVVGTLKRELSTFVV